MDLKSFEKNIEENQNDYISRLKNEFFKKMENIIFKGKNVSISEERNEGEYNTFSHIISTRNGKDRKYSYDRAKYVLNIPMIFNNIDLCNEIITFKDGNRDIIYNIENGNDFMIVLEDVGYYYLLITAYKVNWENSRDYYYKEKIIELNELEYSHNYNFTKIYRLKTQTKEIYIDEVIKTWIEDYYTQDIIFRIIATAINDKRNKIIYIVYKNHYHIPKEEKNYIYIISKYANSLNNDKLLQIMGRIEKTLKILREIYNSDANNNLKLIRLILQSETAIEKIAKKFGKCKKIKKCMNLIEKEVGYFATSNSKFKFKKQFPEIIKTLLSRDENQIQKVYDKYKVEYDENIIIKDQNIKKYYLSYFRKFFTDFSNTIYGTDYEC